MPDRTRRSAADGSCPYPLAYNPEFVNAYEIGTKNTLLNGSLTLDGAFYYDYNGYQISRSSPNRRSI